MSLIPKGELSTDYTYISKAMSSGIKKIMENDYVIGDQIPINVLKDAKELFDNALIIINDIPPISRQATSWLMVLNHLRKINPSKYPNNIKDKNPHKLIYQDVRNLASLLNNLKELKEVPIDQRGDCVTLQKFFEALSETGERTAYEEYTSGERAKRYAYSLG